MMVHRTIFFAQIYPDERVVVIASPVQVFRSAFRPLSFTVAGPISSYLSRIYPVTEPRIYASKHEGL